MKYISALLILTALSALSKAPPVQHVYTPDQLAREVEAQKPKTLPIPPYSAGYFHDENSDDCLELACRLSGEFGCDSKEKTDALVSLCQAKDSAYCLRKVCDRQGIFACDEYEEVKKILSLCAK
jgi:hypothetical protein